jgi:hypothetical protein
MVQLRYAEPSLPAILGGNDMPIESPLIQEILEELLREEHQTVILGILQRKFGAVPEDLNTFVRALQDAEILRSLVLEAAISTDLDAFRAKLPPSRSSAQEE